MTHKDENIVDSTGQRKFFKLLDFLCIIPNFLRVSRVTHEGWKWYLYLWGDEWIDVLMKF